MVMVMTSEEIQEALGVCFFSLTRFTDAFEFCSINPQQLSLKMFAVKTEALFCFCLPKSEQAFGM